MHNKTCQPLLSDNTLGDRLGHYSAAVMARHVGFAPPRKRSPKIKFVILQQVGLIKYPAPNYSTLGPKIAQKYNSSALRKAFPKSTSEGRQPLITLGGCTIR